MSNEQDFRFVVGHIEDGIVALLQHRYQRRDDNPTGDWNQVGSYAGELDEKSLKNAIESLSGDMPLGLVAYGGGTDKLAPATSPAFGTPRIWRHTCIFTVMVVDNNARSETEQRRGSLAEPGAYKMVTDVDRALAGISFAFRPNDSAGQVVVRVPNRPLTPGDVLLNLDPFQPDGIDYIARLQGMTAYAIHFQTYFNRTEPDRRVADTMVEELIFDLTPLDGPGQPAPRRPGVM